MGKRALKGGKGAPLPHLRSRTTRSSRGRLIPLESTSTPSLDDQLRLLGLYAANTLGDGNCLFRALADQVYGSPVRHADVRRDVCDWIEKHGERYEGFVEFEGSDEEDDKKGKGKGVSKRLQNYLRNMRENGTYGGHMELSAFAHMMKRNIKVVQPGLVYVIEWRAGSPASTLASGSVDVSSSQTTVASQSASVPLTAGSKSKSQSTPTSISAAPTSSSMSGRRSTRSASKSEGGDGDQKKLSTAELDAGKTKVRVGKGYYVLEEVTSSEDEADDDDKETVKVKQEEAEENEVERDVMWENEEPEEVPIKLQEDEDGGPTIYVAYHDWEHFSSIRNLRGPHTGLPNIQETPAPPSAFAEYGLSSSTAAAPFSKADEQEILKEREREKKREEKKKEKERERQRREKASGALKVKLRIPPKEKVDATTTINAELTTIPMATMTSGKPMSGTITTPTVASTIPGVYTDPICIPLPTSRSASPYPNASLSRHAGLAPSLDTGYRSPKRSFDESSASTSGGEDKDSKDDTSSGREEKRVRRRMPSGMIDRELERGSVPLVVDLQQEMDVNVVDVDGDIGGTDTPALSAPGSSSSSSSSELSEASSSPSPEPGMGIAAADGENNDDIVISPPPSQISTISTSESPKTLKKGTQKYQQQRHLEQGLTGEKLLTRRQRKALGLPKVRKVVTSQVSPGLGQKISAGKIVIPGGRWSGRPTQTATGADGGEGETAEEWRRNGTGRLDVRGFKELKI